MITGNDLLSLAETRLKQKYQNVLVPKNNSAWQGPWDCAEFVSWVVFQKIGKLYGCTDNDANPATVEAYSGAWVRDAKNGLLIESTQAEANNTAGVILIRRPPAAGKMGHVAISDGQGGTVEAAGTGLGVRRGKIEGRLWHFWVKIPDVIYQSSGVEVQSKPLPFLLELKTPYMTGERVVLLQQALEKAEFSTGGADGKYGPMTMAAVAAFQKVNKLVSDGVVGPATAKKLGIVW